MLVVYSMSILVAITFGLHLGIMLKYSSDENVSIKMKKRVLNNTLLTAVFLITAVMLYFGYVNS